MSTFNGKGKLIESFYSALAGVTFENRQSLLRNLYTGQQLVLKRMPYNPYDSNAIAVYDPSSMQQVGFIRKYVAVNLAPIMDRDDREVCCTVKELTGGGDYYTGVNILIEIFDRNATNGNEDVTHWRNAINTGTNTDTYNDPLDVYKGINYYDTGMRYLTGTGVVKDESKAFYWIHEAAKCGHSLAQSLLGMMYARGIGVEENHEKAFSWMYKAAAQGDAEAQNVLGNMYSEGFGVEKDEKKAFEWLSKSATQGFAKAQFYLGIKYIMGVGVKKDLQKAAVWLERAAFQGDKDAQYSLGAMYERGDYFDKNDELAISWYEKSAIQGCEEARERLKILNKC